jgi:hypothetical protein
MAFVFRFISLLFISWFLTKYKDGLVHVFVVRSRNRIKLQDHRLLSSSLNGIVTK